MLAAARTSIGLLPMVQRRTILKLDIDARYSFKAQAGNFDKHRYVANSKLTQMAANFKLTSPSLTRRDQPFQVVDQKMLATAETSLGLLSIVKRRTILKLDIGAT